MNKNTPEYSGFQHFVLWLIAALFMLFITLFIPDKHRTAEVLVFLLGVPLMCVVIVSTATNLAFLYNFRAWKIIARTATVLLLIPAIMATIYYSHLNSYMTAIPSDNRIAFRISAEVKQTGGSGSIGNEWSYKHTINNNTFSNGDIVEISIKKPFTITSTITEDDGTDDVGTTTSNPYSFRKSEDYTEEITITNNVKVVERGGRKNSGAYATFSVRYALNRVLPEDFTFFDVYFFTNDSTQATFLWCILAAGVVGIAYIVFVIYAGKQRAIRLEAERKAEEERKFQAEKSAFIVRLGGKRMRDAAGVPGHITYKNGKPVDNNNAEFGTFTAYLSNSGKCFHRCKGCCSAYKPTHLFTATQYYKPCSKCSATHYSIPDWHLKYMELKKEAKKYGIEE